MILPKATRGEALGPALDAVIADPEVDLTRLRVTRTGCYTARVSGRRSCSCPPPADDTLELAVDLRRAGDADTSASAVAVESVALVERRIERALAVVAPERLLVTPDCQLQHLPASIARAKLQAMTRAAVAERARIAGRPPRL